MHLILRNAFHNNSSNAYSKELFRVYNKTLEYVKTFTKFNTTDSASAVREFVRSLLSGSLHKLTCV
jgi:hypothetical protein